MSYNSSSNILVNSIEVIPRSLAMSEGDTEYLNYMICPYCADNQNVLWSSSNTKIAIVNATSGLVTAKSAGTVTIYANSQDGSGVKGSCYITVEEYIPVTSVSLNSKEISMSVGDSLKLSATVLPNEASNKTVVWSSNNPTVVDVDYFKGFVYAKSAGTAMVTATSVDGNYMDSCCVNVKEIVIIDKDSYYSNVIFSDGHIWKCNVYHYDNILEENIPYDSQRAFHNCQIDFSKKQLGFLFRIDPNGVIYYVKNKNLGNDASTTDYLIYRDDIFKEIYGKKPHYFIYDNSQIYYCKNINYNNRYDVYSEAELLFGILPRWSLQNIAEIFLGAIISLLSIYYPGIAVLTLSYDVATAFFFTGAFEKAVNAAANEFTSQFLESNYDKMIAKRFGWASAIVNFIPSILESSLPPDVDEVQIALYENAYSNDNYLIRISNNNQIVDLDEIVQHYKDLLAQ